MHKLFIAVLLIGAIGVTGLYIFRNSKPDATIIMGKDQYEPRNITVSEGSTVRFENKDTQERWPASNIHPTHDIYPAFDPQRSIAISKYWDFRFTQKGAWRYHDHINPLINGTITVN